jgi:type I restriction enzyme S subunit
VPQDPNDEPALTLLKRIKQERGNVPKPKRMRKAKAKNKRITMADLKEVLAEASEWMNAREAFRQCGIGDGAPTDLIEKLYEELKEQVAQRVVEVERRGDEDWFRLITER